MAGIRDKRKTIFRPRPAHTGKPEDPIQEKGACRKDERKGGWRGLSLNPQLPLLDKNITAKSYSYLVYRQRGVASTQFRVVPLITFH